MLIQMWQIHEIIQDITHYEIVLAVWPCYICDSIKVFG